MAGTITKSKSTSTHNSACRDCIVEHNKLVTDVETLRAQVASLGTKLNGALAKLDADAGVTDTTYVSLWGATLTTVDTASDLLAAQIGGPTGVALT